MHFFGSRFRPYPASLAVLGVLALSVVTIRTGLSLVGLVSAFAFVFAAAFQSIYTTNLGGRPVSLLPVTALGVSLLLGGSVAAWSMTLGICLGFAGRFYLARRLPAADSGHWLIPRLFSASEFLLILGATNLAIFSAWLPGALTPGGLYLNSTNQAYQQILFQELIFTFSFYSFVLIQVWINPQPGLHAGRTDHLSLAAVAILPLPFIFLASLTAPQGLPGVVLLLTAIPAIISLLIYMVASSRSELRHRQQELSTLNQVSQALQTSRELNTLLDSIQQQVRQLFQVDNFFVALFDQVNHTIWYPLAVQQGQLVNWEPRPLMNRLTDRVILDKTPVLFPTHAKEDMARNGYLVDENTPTAWMGVPLFSSEQSIGCLAVYSQSPETQFRENDLKLLTTLSGQVSLAVVKTQLDQQVAQFHQEAHEKELLTENLVHDLRSPLGTVISALDIILERSAPLSSQDGKTIHHAANLATEGAYRVLELVDTLLDVSRLESGQMELHRALTDLPAMLKRISEQYRRECDRYQIKLLVTTPPDFPHIFVDSDLLNRTITNLLDNAVKFTPDGGQIYFSAQVISGNSILLQVEDSGPGIPVDYIDKIFERFVKVPGQVSRRKGTGLGLTLCKLAVEAHGGKISVEPSSLGGSKFILDIPIN